MPELIVILVIVLVVFGAGKLPEIGTGIGKSIRNFRQATSGNGKLDADADKTEPGRLGDAKDKKSGQS